MTLNVEYKILQKQQVNYHLRVIESNIIRR